MQVMGDICRRITFDLAIDSNVEELKKQLAMMGSGKDAKGL